jgi:DNA-binding response OmpR family regulator
MLDAGAADYVEFPFDTDELLARIRSLIRISHLARLDSISNVKGISERIQFGKDVLIPTPEGDAEIHTGCSMNQSKACLSHTEET